MRTEAVALVLGLGIGAGIARWPRPVPAANPTPASRPRVVCARRTVVSQDCSDVAARQAWCEGRLRAIREPRPTTMPPEAEGLDDPAAFDRLLDRVRRECGGVRARATDCTEYPCVAALEAEDPMAVGRCEAVFPPGADEPVVVPVPVTCPDGTERTMWMFGVMDRTVSALYPNIDRQFLAPELLMLGGRRAEALAGRFPCE